MQTTPPNKAVLIVIIVVILERASEDMLHLIYVQGTVKIVTGIGLQ